MHDTGHGSDAPATAPRTGLIGISCRIEAEAKSAEPEGHTRSLRNHFRAPHFSCRDSLLVARRHKTSRQASRRTATTNDRQTHTHHWTRRVRMREFSRRAIRFRNCLRPSRNAVGMTWAGSRRLARAAGCVCDCARPRAARGRSGGRERVPVKLEEIVGGGDHAPLRPDGGLASSVEATEAAVVLGLAEHGLDRRPRCGSHRRARCARPRSAHHFARTPRVPRRYAEGHELPTRCRRGHRRLRAYRGRRERARLRRGP